MISKEAKRLYDQQRYLTKYRPLRFKDRRCAACGILLISKCGAKNTRTYCLSCSKSKHADRISSKTYYYKNREKVLARIRARGDNAVQLQTNE